MLISITWQVRNLRRGTGGTSSSTILLLESLQADSARLTKGWIARCSGVAQAHSDDMAATSFFNHYSQNGSSPYDRIKNTFPSAAVVSELIAAGWTDVRSVVVQFMW